MAGIFYHRFGRAICVAALIALPVTWYCALLEFQSNSNNVLDWLPESFEETNRLIWFAQRFGSDEILVVSWPGCTLDDPRLDRLAARLLKPFPAAGGGPARILFRHVFTGRQTLKEMMARPLNLSRGEALARMRGWLVGSGEKTTCAVALVSEAGSADRQAAVDAVGKAARAVGIQPADIRLGGPTADGAAIDRASQQWMLQMILLSACCSMLVAWWCLGQWRLVGILFLTATIAWGTSLTVMRVCGVHMDAVLMMMPGLVFVLAISGAVHLSYYYFDAVRETGAEEAPIQAIRRGWLPCSLAAGTTAIGLGSLTLSQVMPVARFGVFSAIGVLVALASLLLFWPSAMLWWGSERAGPARDPAAGSGHGHRLWWRPLAGLTTGHWLPVVLLAVVVIPPLAVGVTKIGTSARLEDLLAPKSDLIRGYAWLQEHIGPLVPVEIVLCFQPVDPPSGSALLARAALVEHLRHDLDTWPSLGGTVAATTFAPPLPTGHGARQVIQRRLFAARWKRRLEDFVKLRYLYQDHDANEQLWRISTRTRALQGVNYGRLLRHLEREVHAVLASQQARSVGPVRARICGAVPLIYMAQEQLLRDLIKSFLAAFALIAVVMAILMRSLAAGLVSMIPNVFPVLIVFGLMGLSGNAVDIGAMMTASAALGIAVDDTLHFLVWFRRGLSRGLPRRAAIVYAYRSCATAMLQTSLICGLGLIVFVLSPFTPTARFGWLMTVLLGAALAGDLILLPALLTSPLGKFFLPRAPKTVSPE